MKTRRGHPWGQDTLLKGNQMQQQYKSHKVYEVFLRPMSLPEGDIWGWQLHKGCSVVKGGIDFIGCYPNVRIKNREKQIPWTHGPLNCRHKYLKVINVFAHYRIELPAALSAVWKGRRITSPKGSELGAMTRLHAILTQGGEKWYLEVFSNQSHWYHRGGVVTCWREPQPPIGDQRTI
jgi:hypothetical protein